MVNYASPSECLEGLVLEDNWKVIRKATSDEMSTGGRYTAGYLVQRDGESAWLKAMDWSEALKVSADSSKIVAQVLSAFNYERDLHEYCLDRRLSNVVRIVGTGQITIDKFPNLPVFYLILEKGVSDVRKEMGNINRDYYWVFRTLHQIAKGINQLHTNNIAHQDIKPSNIISFSGNIKKLGDLGSACCGKPIFQNVPDHIEQRIPGTYAYAPPELLYKEINPNWDIRRKASDLYQLGSLIVFFLTKRQMNDIIKSHLHQSLHWDRDISYSSYRDVLVYVNQAFGRALDEISIEITDEYLREQIIPVIQQLCNPNPEKRGHPRNFMENSSNFSLIRYITTFSRLYRYYELNRTN
jgi:serine/threonine protein kinase